MGCSGSDPEILNESDCLSRLCRLPKGSLFFGPTVATMIPERLLEMEEDEAKLRATLSAAYDEIEAYYRELEGESPRAAAVLVVIRLEDELESLIRKQFSRADDDQKLWKRLAGPGPTPFGSLKSKIDVGYAFGLYGPKTRKMLERISSIRNKFAHNQTIKDFDHFEIRRHISEMPNDFIFDFKYSDSDDAILLRHNFVQTTQGLANYFSAMRHSILWEGSAPLP